MKGNFFKIKKEEGGYILAFTLVVVGVLLLVSMSVSRIIAKEMMFSRLVDYNRVAYLVADTGLECAQYLDKVLKDDTVGISLILNSTSSSDGKLDFENNAVNNVFFSTSTIKDITSDNYKTKVYCASDGSHNRIFNNPVSGIEAGYVTSRDAVISNLNNSISSYNISGDSLSATTTFGLVIKDSEEKKRCVLVEFGKTKSSAISGVTISFGIISTGFSSCNEKDPNRVSRTIYRYSTN